MADRFQAPSTDSTWEHRALTFAQADAFIRRCLPEIREVRGPLAVFASYDDGPDARVTAQFAIDHPRYRQVVVKANRFPFLRGSVEAHRIVARCAHRCTPKLIGWETDGDGSLLLHDSFQGWEVSSLGDEDVLVEVARTLAIVQRAATPAVARATAMEVTPTSALPAIFERVLDVIRRHYGDAWQPDPGGKILKAMQFPGAEVLDRLEALRPEVNEWAQALGKSKVALSLDHGDCHAGNAARLDTGGVIVFDWENASVAHPYLSVEKLLTSAWALDAGADGGPWGYTRETPTQDRIREAYLGALGSNSPTEERAFDAAMGLAAIKEMWHEMSWASQCGWPFQNPEWSAQLIRRLFEHRKRFQSL